MGASAQGIGRIGWACALFILVVLPRPSVAAAGEENQGLQGGWAIDDQGNLNFT